MNKRYQFLLLACVFTLALALAGTATAQTVIINEDFSGLADGLIAEVSFTANHTWTADLNFEGGTNAAITGEKFEKVGEAAFIRWITDVDPPIDVSTIDSIHAEWEWTPLNKVPCPNPAGANGLFAIEIVDSSQRGLEIFRFRTQSSCSDDFLRIDSDAGIAGLDGQGLRAPDEVAEPNNFITVGNIYHASMTVTRDTASMSLTDITGGGSTLVHASSLSLPGTPLTPTVGLWNEVEMSILQVTLCQVDNIFVGINGAVPVEPVPTPTPIPPAGVDEWSLYK